MLSSAHTESVAVYRLWWAAPLAGAVAATGNLLVWALARALAVPLEIPMGAQATALTAGLIVSASFVPAPLAAVLLATLPRLAARPLRVFQLVGGAALLLSLLGPLALPVAGVTKAVLLAMHVVAALAIIGVLSSAARVGRP